jgi:hypothetical protein
VDAIAGGFAGVDFKAAGILTAKAVGDHPHATVLTRRTHNDHTPLISLRRLAGAS